MFKDKKTVRAIVQNIGYLTQLGFSIAFPPVFCAFGALWLQRKTGAGSWLLMTLQCQAFGVRGQDGNLLLEPKLQSCQFGSDGVAEISCTCAGKQLQVRYHNPQSLDWGEYRIEKAVCKNKVWQCGGGSLCIPRQSLPAEDCLTVDVTLVSAASGGTRHV